MRILILSNVFPPGFIGGYELGAFDVYRGLLGNGHEVEVLTSDYFPGDEAVPHVSRTLTCWALRHELGEADPLASHYYDFSNVRVLARTLREFRPDVVLAFNLSGLGPMALLSFLRDAAIPTVLYLMDDMFAGVDTHSPLFRAFGNVFGSLRPGDSSTVVAMSDNVADACGRSLGCELRVTQHVPGWVDAGALPGGALERSAEDGRRFVFLSRVAPHKGIDLVLEASEQLVASGWDAFTVDVYGAGLVAPFLQSVSARSLDRHVFYRGLLDKAQVLPTLARYDALLFPTWEREAFGFVVPEAAAAGCLPVLTAGIGAGEWFVDGYDCLKIARTAESLRGAMLQVLTWNAAELTERRDRSRRSVSRDFAFSRWLPKIEQLCQEAAASGGPRLSEAALRGLESAYLCFGTLLRSVET